jgi:hypothetical protein
VTIPGIVVVEETSQRVRSKELKSEF